MHDDPTHLEALVDLYQDPELEEKEKARVSHEKKERSVKFRKWKERAKSEEFFDYFGGLEGEVKRDAVLAYLNENEEHLKPFEQEVLDAFDNEKSTDPDVQLIASKQISKLCEYLNERKAIALEAQTKLEAIKLKKLESAYLSSKAWQGIKIATGTAVEGFQNSKGHEKVMYLAAAGVGLAIVYKISKWAFVVNEKDPFSKDDVKLRRLILLGIPSLIIAAEAVNKSVERTRGAPLFSLEKGMVLPSKETWDAANYKAELDSLADELRGADIPEFLFREYETDEEKKNLFGIANFCTMKVGELESLYEKYKEGRSMPHVEPYPKKPFEDDHLTDVERFVLLKELSDTLGFLHEDPATGEKEFRCTEEQVNMRVLYECLDFVPPKEDEEEEVKEEGAGDNAAAAAADT